MWVERLLGQTPGEAIEDRQGLSYSVEQLKISLARSPRTLVLMPADFARRRCGPADRRPAHSPAPLNVRDEGQGMLSHFFSDRHVATIFVVDEAVVHAGGVERGCHFHSLLDGD